jgi:succinyl-diaminopimelate desuccinylase
MAPTTQQLTPLSKKVAAHEADMVELLKGLIRVPALGPRNGGQGERAKADWLRSYCERHGFTVEEYTAPDPSVDSKGRPNLLVRAPGSKGDRTLWIMSHIDVVPPGNLKDWTVTPPYEPKLKDGRLYGRGSEDNGQSLAAAFWALKTIQEEGLKPEMNIHLLFVADEETGSGRGIGWMLEAHKDLFKPNDLILVPDGGDAKGEFIEISEKSLLWVRVITKGVQCHGSMPYLGKNAHRAAAHVTLALDKALHEKYPDKDPLFMPPESTFEPTKHEANVPNINTIPGEEVFHFDCRILPKYDSKAAFAFIQEVASREAAKHGCTATVELVQHDPAAPPTPASAPIVTSLKAAIKATRGLDAKVGRRRRHRGRHIPPCRLPSRRLVHVR